MTVAEKWHLTPHYYKVWFSDGKEITAKLVVNTHAFPLRSVFNLKDASVSEFSSLFPVFDAGKMKRLIIGSVHETWNAAFLSEDSQGAI